MFAEFNKAELDAVERIIDRARTMASDQGVILDRLSLHMDLSAAHALTPLRLEELSAADDFNLMHDISGILRHLDRRTGHLTDFFVPRYVK